MSENPTITTMVKCSELNTSLQNDIDIIIAKMEKLTIHDN